MNSYDALIIVSFGGPEGMDDVMPFLENVVRGKNVPADRLSTIAHHYDIFGGVSPINGQNRELKKLLERKFDSMGIKLPVYWGNRNWKPYLKDTILEMKSHGIKNALAFVTSAYGSYSGCRQYLENIEQARKEVGEGAPQIHKLPAFFNNPNFIQVNVKNIQEQIEKLPANEKKFFHIAFTAHSIPTSMSQTSPYLLQLQRTCQAVAQKLRTQNWKLVFQSRSGPPTVPWLDPDISEHLETLAKQGFKSVIASPIGFISDHMEVIYDLDVEAKQKAEELGITLYRAKTPGNDPLMIDMISSIVQNYLNGKEMIACKPHCCTR